MTKPATQTRPPPRALQGLGHAWMNASTVDNRPHLPEVTLVAVTSVALQATVHALEASMQQARFARALLLSDVCPWPETNPAIEWRRIEPLHSRPDYARFVLQELAHHIGTSHALLIQWDGFVLDGSAWDPRFLDYDYIGAVWPHHGDAYRVGNGGFSLRSRWMLQLCQDLRYDGFSGEDVVICRGYRPFLEEQGVCFAPEHVARRFSYERLAANGGEFGFHGIFNLVRLLGPKERQQLIGELEPHVLARDEQKEILRWAVARGDIRLTMTMLRRLQRKRPHGRRSAD